MKMPPVGDFSGNNTIFWKLCQDVLAGIAPVTRIFSYDLPRAQRAEAAQQANDNLVVFQPWFSS